MKLRPPLSTPISPSKSLEVRRIGDTERTGADDVITEEPLEIRLGGGPIDQRESRNVAVTMRTPGHDGDLALGFLYCESLILDLAQIRSHGHCDDVGEDERGNAYRVELHSDVPLPEPPARHSFVSSSCGVCGKRSIAEVRAMIEPDTLANDPYRTSAGALFVAAHQLRDHQPLFATTGAIHAAATIDRAGGIVRIREDVGRHNALDKLIGASLIAAEVPLHRTIMVSGRVGFELVQKAARAGCPVLAAVGGPSSLAIEAASALGMTLVAFVRDQRMNIYTYPERIEA